MSMAAGSDEAMAAHHPTGGAPSPREPSFEGLWLPRRRDTVRAVNTTNLITQWTMEGAGRDLGRTFAPAVDIVATVSGLASEDGIDETTPASRPLLLKSADGSEWLPLAAGA